MMLASQPKIPLQPTYTRVFGAPGTARARIRLRWACNHVTATAGVPAAGPTPQRRGPQHAHGRAGMPVPCGCCCCAAMLPSTLPRMPAPPVATSAATDVAGWRASVGVVHHCCCCTPLRVSPHQHASWCNAIPDNCPRALCCTMPSSTCKPLRRLDLAPSAALVSAARHDGVCFVHLWLPLPSMPGPCPWMGPQTPVLQRLLSDCSYCSQTGYIAAPQPACHQPPGRLLMQLRNRLH